MLRCEMGSFGKREKETGEMMVNGQPAIRQSFLHLYLEGLEWLASDRRPDFAFRVPTRRVTRLCKDG